MPKPHRAAMHSRVSSVVSSWRRASFHPHPLDEPTRGLAHLGGEDPGEVAHAHGGGIGEDGNPVVAVGLALDQVLDGPHRRPLRSGHPHRCGELGLSTGAVKEHDQPSGHRLGHLVAQVVLDEGEGQIDPGGDPGTGPVLPVPDVDRIGIDLQRGKVGRQCLGAGPVGGDPPPVEQTRLGGQKRAGADGGHPPAGRGDPFDPRQQRGVPARRPCPITSGQEEGVDRFAGDGQRNGAQTETALGPDRFPIGRRQCDAIAAGAPE